jgi:hypothetical protein
MKTIVTAAISLCLILGGCANTYTYLKAGADTEATHADMLVCRSVMARLAGDDAKEAFDKCMADKGYEKQIDKFHL